MAELETTTPEVTGTDATTDPQDTTTTVLDGGEEQQQTTTETTEQKHEEEKVEEAKSVLDDDEPEAKKPETEEEKPPTDEEVAKWKESIRAFDLGDGIKIDDPLLDSMTPALMKLSKNDPKAVEQLCKDFAEHRQKKANAITESNNRFSKALVDECRSRFGVDADKYFKDAKAGGALIWKKEFWDSIKRIPALANNPDFIEGLALVQRKLGADNAVVPTATTTAKQTSPDWVNSMYGGIK